MTLRHITPGKIWATCIGTIAVILGLSEPVLFLPMLGVGAVLTIGILWQKLHIANGDNADLIAALAEATAAQAAGIPVQLAPVTRLDPGTLAPRLRVIQGCGNCQKCLADVPAYPGSWLTVPMTRMIVCGGCGNKRCPKASDHDLACTASNEPGQLGSVYGGIPIQRDGSDWPAIMRAVEGEVEGS